MPGLLRRRYPILKRCLDLSIRLRRRTGAGGSVCIALSPSHGGIDPDGAHVVG